MKPKAITFDCAGTLVDVHWSAAGLGIECAQACGLILEKGDAFARYERLLQTRWIHYGQINALRDDQACDDFWRELTIDWLTDMGQPTDATEAVLEAAREKLYGPSSTIFQLFEDTIPGIEAVKAAGYRVAVLSNWDYTLIRVLRFLKIDHYFECVVASLLEGVEKPDPRLFQITADRLGLEPSEIVHVGDCPNDDILGAHNAGFGGIRIDRSQVEPSGRVITSLPQIVSVLQC